MAKNEQSSKRRQDRNEKERQSSRGLQRHEERGEQPARTGSPFGFMRRFSEEMDRLFEDFGFGQGIIAPTFERGLDQLGALGKGAWAPQVEVVERNNELVIRTDLPGMKKDDVQVDIDENSLVIQGERRSEQEEDGEGYYRTERSYGRFYRRIPLPKGVDPDEASADFRDGVLEITLPVPKEVAEKSRRLEIGGERETQPRGKAKAADQR
jgi:HSP20 family protein